jgi:hypothetical protein
MDSVQFFYIKIIKRNTVNRSSVDDNIIIIKDGIIYSIFIFF